MSIALCRGFDLSFAGQTITQRVQPVQSSGATWMRYLCPFKSLDLKSTAWKVRGAKASAAGSKIFARMAACGQTIAHLLHWMQSASSQTGISEAMLRFSHFVVPVGQVPSGGKADTGSKSPLFAIITAVTRLTNSGAAFETMGGIAIFEVTASGTATRWRFASVASMAWKFFCTTCEPFLPYVFSTPCLMAAIASSFGNTPEMAKK